METIAGVVSWIAERGTGDNSEKNTGDTVWTTSVTGETIYTVIHTPVDPTHADHRKLFWEIKIENWAMVLYG